jgi:hypothetical protein
MALSIKWQILSMVVMTALLASPVICVSMYPYGVSVGDTIAPVNDDGSTAAIPLSIPGYSGFKFFYSLKNNIYVSMVIQRSENSAKTANIALKICIAYQYLHTVMFKL